MSNEKESDLCKQTNSLEKMLLKWAEGADKKLESLKASHGLKKTTLKDSGRSLKREKKSELQKQKLAYEDIRKQLTGFRVRGVYDRQAQRT